MVAAADENQRKARFLRGTYAIIHSKNMEALGESLRKNQSLMAAFKKELQRLKKRGRAKAAIKAFKVIGIEPELE